MICLFSAPVFAQGPEVAYEPQTQRLEEALRESYLNPDPLQLLGAIRAAVTGVFESYCAVNNLTPTDQGIAPLRLGLGIGCLIGAGTLFYLTGKRIDGFLAGDDARDRLQRYRGAEQQGLSRAEFSAFEGELEAGASQDELSRTIGLVLSIVSFGAATSLFVLAAEGEVDGALGVSVGTGATLVGGISLLSWFLEGPDERAFRTYQAGR